MQTIFLTKPWINSNSYLITVCLEISHFQKVVCQDLNYFLYKVSDIVQKKWIEKLLKFLKVDGKCRLHSVELIISKEWTPIF